MFGMGQECLGQFPRPRIIHIISIIWISPCALTRQNMIVLRPSEGVACREYVATAILLQQMLRSKFNRPFDRPPCTDPRQFASLRVGERRHRALASVRQSFEGGKKYGRKATRNRLTGLAGSEGVTLVGREGPGRSPLCAVPCVPSQTPQPPVLVQREKTSRGLGLRHTSHR